MDFVMAAQPRVVALFLLTVLAAMLLGGTPSAFRIVTVLAATGLTVAGAAILNNYLERDIDRRMERTRHRPIAAGAVSPGRALAVGLIVTAVGVASLWVFAGALGAVFGLIGAVYYVLVYTLLLKPRTAMSALPGGLAGVFPPLIGWAAVGGRWSGQILFLCALIVVWSPPHFWALALALKKDYLSSGIPTPAVTYGEKTTRLQILGCVAALTALTLVPVLSGLYGPLYSVVALVAGSVLWIFAIGLFVKRTASSAWALFKYSGPYLAAILFATVLDRLL